MVEKDPCYIDIKKLIPYSDKFNTYFFSEYNDPYPQLFDFPTGLDKQVF